MAKAASKKPRKTTQPDEPSPRKKAAPRATAETMAKGQREISVSEFFAKNRHLLGFDNPRKALLTTVKEAVDNALDACEEASILPDIAVHIEELSPPPSSSKSGRYRVTVLDNGPGVIRKQIENIFGKLLYGSKFHRLKMSRGQQGIGISAAGMYGLMTTGRPMVINTRPNKRKPAHHLELAMDTTKNKPEVTLDIETDEFPDTTSGTGTMVAIELEARYVKGKASVDAYIEQTAIANPHAKFTYIPPGKAAADTNDEPALLESAQDPDQQAEKAPIDRTTELDDKIIYPRTVGELPHEPKEIKPHPYGVELGTFLRMLKDTDETQIGGFLKKEFCRVTPAVANDIFKAAGISNGTWLKTINHAAAEKIYTALQDSKLRAPPTDCLSPIGVRQMLAGLLKGVRAEFYSAATREPAVYRGNPFQIEAAIAFGGDLPGDESARVIRFANRVPLLYQQSSCASFKSVAETAWRNYGLSQPRGALPTGPLVVMIHMASVWVPFTSESKEAIADYDEIRKEMRLALQECGRKLGTYMRRRQKMKREGQRRDVFERYIGEVSKACESISGADAALLYESLIRQARHRTEIADRQLDDEGRFVNENGNGRLDNDDGVIIVTTDEPDDQPPTDSPLAPIADEPDTPRPKPVTKKKTQAVQKTQQKSPRKKSGVKNKGKAKPHVRLSKSDEPSLFDGGRSA